ncbi:hypothetical protein [Xylanibacter muris]|uniref:DUF5119 domain-containing protein n=1 Tax=Xylanibacter muris TaxID=2736290 RepID=A0ABX2AMX0_9BACT|nr:hypothetical protein [Xylanibacter muris]NPD92554.1 hypothetical protein [Xylanibacter muris]
MRKGSNIISFLVACMSLLALAACEDEPLIMSGAGDGNTKVNLCISVNTADVHWPVTRSEAVYPEDPVNANEKMHTLRIIVVRPDGTVEANHPVMLASPNTYYGYEKIEVEPNERKKVYLFVNEQTKRENTDGRLMGRMLGEIRVGTQFPKEEMESIMLTLGDGEQIAGPLPMTECHEVEVKDEDVATTLFVTRAAVKVSFHITNNSPAEYNITGLKIHKMADRMYYLPRNAVYEDRVSDDGVSFKDIRSFDTPDNVTYATYDIYRKAGLDGNTGQDANKLNAGGGRVDIAPVYLLEGKYTDADSDGKNYSLTLSLDGTDFHGYLPNLPQLPRNTHADIYITIDNDRQITIMPLRNVSLEMDFGFDDLFPKDHK